MRKLSSSDSSRFLRSAIRSLSSAPLDWTLLLIPLIGMVAAWPLMTQSLPSTDDGALHLYRLVEIDRCLRHGVLPLRWAPDFAHGYGYPFFNFYASLSSYIAELWHLAGLDFTQAIAAATITALFVSGWGAYLLGRDLAGRKAGLVAATSYMYAPYQFYDSAYRGNLAESWALALLPWVLWTGRRAAHHTRSSDASPFRWRAIVPCVLACAAFIYTHNVYALITLPILAVYLVVLWWQDGRSWRQAWRLSTMLALGLALSAFFWLPAFLEKSWTRYSTDLVDYRTYFLSSQELLSPPPRTDLSRLNPYPPRSLGWGMLILAAAGLVTSFAWRRRPPPATLSPHSGNRSGDLSRSPRPARAMEWVLWGVVFLGASWMTVHSSDIIWRTVPLIESAQIPWRYLGLASLAGSLLAGAWLAHMPDTRSLGSPALLACGVAIVLLVATAIPWTYAAPFPQPENPGVAEIAAWEYGSKLIGTTAQSEFLPIWSPRLPSEPADPALLTEHDPTIVRLDENSLPAGATVRTANYALQRAELVVDTPEPFRALYKQLYFPGWEVLVDGRRTAPVATQPYGLLGFDVPAGEHHILIRPTTTPLRLLGESISTAALLAMATLLIADRRRIPGRESLSSPGPLPRPQARMAWLPPGHWVFIALLAVGSLALKEGVIDRTENLFRARVFEPPGQGSIPGAGSRTSANLGNLFTLYGYTLPARPIVAGEPLRLDLYLGARQAIPASGPGQGEYMAYARLVDEQGRLWSLPDNGRPEGFRPPPPTTIWPTDAYAHWAYLAYTLPGTPPGEYWVQVGFFERGTWRSLNVMDEQGQTTGLSMRLGPVKVVRPHRPPKIAALGVARPLDAPAGPDLQCIGSAQDLETLEAGDTLHLTLFWQASRAPSADYSLHLALLAAGERALPLGDGLPLGRAAHPTSRWEKGEIVRSPHQLRIPASADAGPFAIQATVVDGNGQPAAAPFVVSEGTIRATERMMSVPAMQRQVHADLEGQVTLLGYDLVAAPPGSRVKRGESLPVTLYWQAQREMESSWKVFLQLVGSGGVLAQVDAIPVDWTRPTTGWVVGETIVDSYSLQIPADAPPGTYRLIAGMYDEDNLQRLRVSDSSGSETGDHIVLGELVVE